MRILAIETSCDETAVALLDITGPKEAPDIKVLGNSLYSQAKLHAEYGGVYPNLAKREHEKNLPILLEKTLTEANEALEAPELDVIAVTQGPGLEPALWAGITFAEELGRKWGIPVIPVDHMEGHVWSVLYKESVELPALALLVSGGHTELVLVKDFGKYEILGRTRDDAVGEAFDKVARILGLPYPGGPEISKLALEARSKKLEAGFTFPRPMLNSGDLDFSYSGLKTAVLYKVKELGELNEETKTMIARGFEDAAIEVLITKTKRAIESHPVKSLIVAGGVSVNRYLRQEITDMLEEFPYITLHLPTPELCGDNAVMIGIAAYINGQAGRDIKARGNQSL